MNAIKVMKLLKKYIKCPKCGNELVGNGEGAIIIEDDVFIRKCKCGYHHCISEAEIKLKEGEI